MKRSVVMAAVLFPMLVVQGRAQDSGIGVLDPSLDSLLNIRLITASKHWQTASDAPASTTIIRADDIKRFGYRTLGDVIASMRGFYMTDDRNYSYVGVRGFSRPTDYNNRILLLVNGHTLNEGFCGSSPFGTDFPLDLDAIDRIEIVRGPGSVLYGSGAMFAVVNVISRTGANTDRIRLFGETGSFGRKRVSAIFGETFSEGVDGMLAAQWADVRGQNLYFNEYDADSTHHGVASGLDWDRHFGLLSLLDYKSLVLQAGLTSRQKGIPTGAFDVAFNDPRTKTVDRFGFVEARFSREVDGDKAIMARAWYDHYHYAGDYPYSTMSHDATNANRIGGEVQCIWDLSSGNRLVSGLTYVSNIRSDYRNWTDDTTYFDGDFPYRTFSLYLQDELQLTGDFALTLGVRRATHSVVGSSVMPRAAAVYHPSASGTAKLLFGQAYRTPSMYELNFEDPLSGFKANRGLAREQISTLELELSQRLADELYGVASLYTYTMRNLIDQVIDPADSLVQFQNAGKVRAKGLECELRARLHSGLNGYVSYTYENAKNADGNSRLTNCPVHMLKLGLGYGVADYLRAALEMQYQTGRLSVQGSSTEPFLIANLNLSTAPPATGKSQGHVPDWFQVSLLVRNMFNATYKTPGGFEHRQAAIVQNGREYILKLELTL